MGNLKVHHMFGKGTFTKNFYIMQQILWGLSDKRSKIVQRRLVHLHVQRYIDKVDTAKIKWNES